MLNSRLAFTTPDSQTYHGTVRYTGAIPPTSGTWLGLEWDDVSRGKHSGVYKTTGVRYFDCAVGGAGSFLRPNAKGLERPRSFGDALISKYGPPSLVPSPSTATESRSTLTEPQAEQETKSYSAAFHSKIEVILNSKRNQRGLDGLKEIGLEGACVDRCADSPEERECIKKLTNLHTLNLSQCLISNLDELDQMVDSIPSLRNLILNSNRFETMAKDRPVLKGLDKLTTLSLNNTMVDWNQMVILASSLPSLTDLQIGSNSITSLSSSTSTSEIFASLTAINLEANGISSWDEICISLGTLPSLRKLILTSNLITQITPPLSNTISFRSLESLAIASNQITDWNQIDMIRESFKGLKELWIADNPFLSSSPLSESELRSQLVAKLPSLTSLEGSIIHESENDNKTRPLATSPLAPNPDATAPRRLITLYFSVTKSLFMDHLEFWSISVLPTLPIRSLRSKISKLLPLGPPIPKTRFRFSAILHREGAQEDDQGLMHVDIPVNEESREISYWGIEDGDIIHVIEI